MRIDRLRSTLLTCGGTELHRLVLPEPGLSVTSAPGVCSDEVGSTCTVGNVGAACSSGTRRSAIAVAVNLDSTQRALGRPRPARHREPDAGGQHRHPRDRLRRQQRARAGARPVHVRSRRASAPCTAPSCDGTPRVVDAGAPNPAFPTFGDVDGGFEVVIAEGFAHVDVVAAEDDANNPVVEAIGDFLARNVQ